MCDESYSYLHKLNLENVKVIHHKELEIFNTDLLIAKANRSKVEYFYTLSPASCYYILNTIKEVDLITYLDADLFFFQDPEPIFKELKNKSVGIIEHRFGWLTKRNIIYGKYNVGWISFRNNVDGLVCLKDWMNNCINWCYQKLEDGKYADQKYLDIWPEKYKGVCIIQNKGANLAVWNVSNYKLSKVNNMIFVDDTPLIFYHFANLKQLDNFKFKTDLSRVFKRTKGIIKYDIYMPYINKLLTNKVIDKKIYSKKDAHLSGVYSIIVNFTRWVRESIFPDIIDIKQNV
jgi:hypothetical protein